MLVEVATCARHQAGAGDPGPASTGSTMGADDAQLLPAPHRRQQRPASTPCRDRCCARHRDPIKHRAKRLPAHHLWRSP